MNLLSINPSGAIVEAALIDRAANTTTTTGAENATNTATASNTTNNMTFGAVMMISSFRALQPSP